MLGPPTLEATSLSADWTALIEWVGVQETGLKAEQTAAESELGRIISKVSQTTEKAHDAVKAVAVQEVPAAATMAELGELLAGLRSNAEADLRVFDQEKAKLADLRTRIEALEEEEAVARKLGHLLRTDGFEGWLMHSALEQLAERATERLLELSDSQYSLVLDDRAFSVRDHANADELRSARTLSGGETFLASLSLALALAEATAELAPEGAPRIDSIFLDEGFGTLDPHTLDIVASAPSRSSARPGEWSASSPTSATLPTECRCGSKSPRPVAQRRSNESRCDVKFSVESGAPEYGIAADADTLEEASHTVDATIERPVDDWEPLPPVADLASPTGSCSSMEFAESTLVSGSTTATALTSVSVRRWQQVLSIRSSDGAVVDGCLLTEALRDRRAFRLGRS